MGTFLLMLHLIMFYTYESSHLVLGLPIPPIPTTSLPVFRGPRPQYEGFPQFVSQNQEVDALEGSTAILECTLVNLASHHTVSWLRSSSVSVLTVGSLVFSSDPRLGVVSPSRPGQTGGTWRLEIRQVVRGDEGEYQCQVNTMQKTSWTVRLRVTAEQYSPIVETTAKTLFSVLNVFPDKEARVPYFEKKLHIPEPTTQTAFQLLPHNHIIPNTTSQGVINVLDKNSNNPKILLAGVSSEAETEEDKDIEKVNSNNSKHDKSDHKEIIVPATASPISDFSYKSQESSALLISIVCFSVIVGILIGVGSMRGLYNRWKNPKPPPSRSRSRTGTIDSRRSSGSRRSQDSNKSYDSRSSQGSRSSKRRMRQKEREVESERMYQEIRPKTRLSPLVEVIEPTPQLDRRGSVSETTDYYSTCNTLSDRSLVSDDSGVSVRGDGPEERKCSQKMLIDNKNLNGHKSRIQSRPAVSNGGKLSNTLEVLNSAVLLASVESLTDSQSKVQDICRGKSRERKIRFNPNDEFSD